MSDKHSIECTAKEIISILSTRVVAQEDMKKSLAIAIRGRHLANLARVSNSNLDSDYKTNVLLEGPTGCGKTEAARTIERELGWPVFTVKATSFTPAGIVGKKVSEIPKDYIQSLRDDKIPQWFIDELNAGDDPSLYTTKHLISILEDALKEEYSHLESAVDKIQVVNDLFRVPALSSRVLKRELVTPKGDALYTTALIDLHHKMGVDSLAYLEQLDPEWFSKERIELSNAWRKCVKVLNTISKMEYILAEDPSETVNRYRQAIGGGFSPRADFTDTWDDYGVIAAQIVSENRLFTEENGILFSISAMATHAGGLAKFLDQYEKVDIDKTDVSVHLKELLRLPSDSLNFYNAITSDATPTNGSDLDVRYPKRRGRHAVSEKGGVNKCGITLAQKKAFIERYGIVFIDEIDKIVRTEAFADNIQRELLLLVEGGVYDVTFGGGSDNVFSQRPESITIDTTGILFIGAGAFSTSSIDDMMPELRGRFPIHGKMTRLTEDDLVRILTMDTGPLMRQTTLLRQEGVELDFDPAIYSEIANKCVRENNKKDIGARRINDIVAQILRPIYLEPERFQGKFTVDVNFIKGIVSHDTRKLSAV